MSNRERDRGERFGGEETEVEDGDVDDEPFRDSCCD